MYVYVYGWGAFEQYEGRQGYIRTTVYGMGVETYTFLVGLWGHCTIDVNIGCAVTSQLPSQV